MPSSQAHLYLKREQLYELVWAKPMQHLAKGYGISDRALAKLCRAASGACATARILGENRRWTESSKAAAA